MAELDPATQDLGTRLNEYVSFNYKRSKDCATQSHDDAAAAPLGGRVKPGHDEYWRLVE